MAALLALPAMVSAGTTNIFSPSVTYEFAEGAVSSPSVSYEFAEGAVSAPSVSYEFGEGVGLAPTVSYQYSEGVVASSAVSYEFVEGFAASPVVSYYYQLVLDSVGDGIPDLWRAQYFGGLGTTTNGISCATCDPDGDGANNFQEYIADTIPTNALSRFHLLGVIPRPTAVVSFQSSSNRIYTLYSNTDLTTGTWGSVPGETNIPGVAGTLLLTNPSPANAQMFFRVGVALP